MQKTAKTYSELAYKKMFTPVNLYAEGLHTYPLFAYKNPILNNFCAQNVCKSMQKYSWFAYILHTCLHTTPPILQTPWVVRRWRGSLQCAA